MRNTNTDMYIIFNVNNVLFLASTITEALSPNKLHTSQGALVQVVCVCDFFMLLFISHCKILEAVIVYFLDLCGYSHEFLLCM